MTFLQHVGNAIKEILHIGTTVAVAAEPLIDTAFPNVAPIYNSAVGIAMVQEAAAPTLTGTGPQKLAQLTASLLPQLSAWAKQNNINWPEADIQKWASAVVDTVNLIPAPTTPPAAPTA